MNNMFSDGKNRRSKFEIYLDVLDCIRNTHKPTRIMYQCNLSWSLLKNVIRDLNDKKLISEEVFSKPSDKRTRYIYHITDKGIAFLEQYHKAQQIYHDMI